MTKMAVCELCLEQWTNTCTCKARYSVCPDFYKYVLSLILLFLSYQQFPLLLTHHLKKIKKF